MVKEDIYKLDKVLDRETERCILKILPEDQEDVKRFINDFLAQRYSTGRIIKYLHTLVSLRGGLNKPFNKASSEDLKRYIIGLEKSDYAEWTKHDFKVILRKYLYWLGRKGIISWLKIKTVKNGKLPEEVLTEDEIKAMAATAYTSRDKAFVLRKEIKTARCYL